MTIPAEGEILKYRETGAIFEVKKITNQFVILYSVDGSMQIVTGEMGLDYSFEKILRGDSPGSGMMESR
jgi:hypothetical protein